MLPHSIFNELKQLLLLLLYPSIVTDLVPLYIYENGSLVPRKARHIVVRCCCNFYDIYSRILLKDIHWQFKPFYVVLLYFIQ